MQPQSCVFFSAAHLGQRCLAVASFEITWHRSWTTVSRQSNTRCRHQDPLIPKVTAALCVQINDRYEFPDELDLDLEDGKWLSENADRSVRNLYKLHSVLVHSGGVHGGHYYAYIQPDRKRWLKFDDERVRPLSDSTGLYCSAGIVVA